MGMANWVKFISFKLLNRKYVLDEVFLKENYGISGDISTTSAAAAASLPTSKKPRSNSGVRAVLTIQQEKKLSFYVISNKSELGKKWLLKMCRENFFPSSSHHVCSTNFEGGARTNMNNVPETIETPDARNSQNSNAERHRIGFSFSCNIDEMMETDSAEFTQEEKTCYGRRKTYSILHKVKFESHQKEIQLQ